MNKKFSVSVIKNIHEKNVRPHSQEYFLGKNILWAVVGTAFGVLGALGSGMIWYLAHNLDFLDFLMDRPSMLSHLFWFGVPMLWCGVAVAGAVALAKWFRSQGCGYRRRAWVVLALILAVQGSAGFALEQSKVGEQVDQLLEQKTQWYRGVNRMHGWLEEHPEAGFLMGKVLEVRGDTVFVLSTRGEKIWEVEHVAEVPRWGDLEVGMQVRVVGEPIDKDRFQALRIRPERGRSVPGGGQKKIRPERNGDRLPKLKDGEPRRPGDRGERPPFFGEEKSRQRPLDRPGKSRERPKLRDY